MAVLILLIGSLVCGVSPVVAWEPERAVHFIVPYGPGGNSDMICRIAAEYMTKDLGVPVVVENIPGAGCVIGWNELLSRPADGYTVGMSSTISSPWGTEVLAPEKPPFVGDDFIPTGSMTGIGGTGGFVCKRGRWPDFMTFVEEVKANPGKIKFGLQGPGMLYDSQFSEFEKLTGLDFKIVYYQDSSNIQTDLLTGDLDVGLLGAATEDFVANVNFSILLLWGKELPAEYPVQGLPMMADYDSQLGFEWEDTTYVKLDFTVRDVIVRADTPPEIIARFEQCMENINNNEDYRKAIRVTAWPYFEKSVNLLASYRNMRDALYGFINSPDYDAWLAKVQ